MDTIYKIGKNYYIGCHVKSTKIEYFVRGTGWKTSRKFTEVETITRASDWFEVTELYRKWGESVAYWSAFHLRAFSDDFVMPYVELRNKLSAYSDEVVRKCFEIAPVNYTMATVFKSGTFDPVALDKVLNTPENVSLHDHLVSLYGEEIASAIKAGL